MWSKPFISHSSIKIFKEVFLKLPKENQYIDTELPLVEVIVIIPLTVIHPLNDPYEGHVSENIIFFSNSLTISASSLVITNSG